MDIPHSDLDEWIWPLPMLFSNPPVISDGFGTKKRGGKGHFGVDIMHNRRAGIDDAHKVVGTRLYCTYPGEMVIATADAIVQELGTGAHGHFIRLSHRVGKEGHSILSIYRHLTGFARGLKQGSLLKQGDLLGPVGEDPAAENDPVHLHFELWDISRTRTYPDTCFDPVCVMRHWSVVANGGERIAHPSPPKGSKSGEEGIASLPKGLESV